MTSILASGRLVWRFGEWVFVSFPDLGRAFRALDKLSNAGRAVGYDGQTPDGRVWIKINR
jgi:hypothetical protein